MSYGEFAFPWAVEFPNPSFTACSNTQCSEYFMDEWHSSRSSGLTRTLLSWVKEAPMKPGDHVVFDLACTGHIADADDGTGRRAPAMMIQTLRTLRNAWSRRHDCQNKAISFQCCQGTGLQHQRHSELRNLHHKLYCIVTTW